jgi:hypothetical protein
MNSLPRTLLILAGLGGVTLAATAQYTESPHTVAPGKFLMEMDALSLVIDREEGNKYTALGAASTFITTGLTENWDIQLGAELFIHQKFDAEGFTDRKSGIGDVFVRTKWRFWSDDTTHTAIALLPFVKIPTNSGGVGNDSIEGGVIVPVEWLIWGGVNLYAMAEVDFIRNATDDGYDTFWYASAALNRPVTSAISLYAELDAGKSSGGEPWQGTVGAGATLAMNRFVTWDFAVYRGISRGAPDWNPVVRVNVAF